MYTQHIFLRNTYMGSIQRGRIAIKETFARPWSVAFFCPKCGELWARLPVDDPDTRWICEERECDEHGGGFLAGIFTKGVVPALKGPLLRIEFIHATANPTKYYIEACIEEDIPSGL